MAIFHDRVSREVVDLWLVIHHQDLGLMLASKSIMISLDAYVGAHHASIQTNMSMLMQQHKNNTNMTCMIASKNHKEFCGLFHCIHTFHTKHFLCYSLVALIFHASSAQHTMNDLPNPNSE